MSIQFYSITLEGRQSITDDFATIPLNLVLLSAAVVELAKSIPVYSLMLSSYLFYCLPLLLFPFTVACRIAFASMISKVKGQEESDTDTIRYRSPP